jgi:hypothetical protein
MKKHSVLLLLALAHLAPVSSKAEEWRSEELNCAVTLPSGGEWTRPPASQPAVKAVAQTNDKSESVVLMVVPLPNSNYKLDDNFIQNFEGGYYPPGKSKKVSGAQLLIQGVPAYKTTGELYANGSIIHRAAILWIVGDKFYQLAAIKLKGAPLEDPTIRAFMSSFHFLKTSNVRPMVAQSTGQLPDLRTLVPAKTTQVDVMRLRIPPRVQELAARMQQATAAKQAWFIEYVKVHADARPLPYHENLGLTAEEYSEFLELSKKQTTLEKTAQMPLQVAPTKEGVQLRFDDSVNLLQPISIDFSDATVTVPLAKMTSPQRIDSGPNGGLLGPHKTYTWTAREGTPESGAWTSVELSLGKMLTTGRTYLQYKAYQFVDKKPNVRFETLLFFDSPQE